MLLRPRVAAADALLGAQRRAEAAVNVPHARREGARQVQRVAVPRRVDEARREWHAAHVEGDDLLLHPQRPPAARRRIGPLELLVEEVREQARLADARLADHHDRDALAVLLELLYELLAQPLRDRARERVGQRRLAVGLRLHLLRRDLAAAAAGDRVDRSLNIARLLEDGDVDALDDDGAARPSFVDGVHVRAEELADAARGSRGREQRDDSGAHSPRVGGVQFSAARRALC